MSGSSWPGENECGTVSAMTINEGMLLGFNPSVDTDVKGFGTYIFCDDFVNSKGSELQRFCAWFYSSADQIVTACSIGTTCFAGSHGKGGLLSSVWRSFQSVPVYLTGWSLMPAGFRNGWQPLKHLHHVYEILLKARGLSGARLISAGSRGYPAFADANLVEEAVTFVTEEYRCLSNLLTKACFDM